jgi:hypothetical protein
MHKVPSGLFHDVNMVPKCPLLALLDHQHLWIINISVTVIMERVLRLACRSEKYTIEFAFPRFDNKGSGTAGRAAPGISLAMLLSGQA